MPSSLPNQKRFRNLGFFDLLRYRLPFPGMVSILHRVSGFLLFLLLPLLLWCWERSLVRPDFFQWLVDCSRLRAVRVFLCLCFWAFFHHLLAGLRFLSLDLHWGVSREASRLTGLLILFSSSLLTFLFFIWLFL